MNFKIDLDHIKLYEIIKESNIPSKSGYGCIKQITVYRIVVFWPLFFFWKDHMRFNVRIIIYCNLTHNYKMKAWVILLRALRWFVIFKRCAVMIFEAHQLRVSVTRTILYVCMYVCISLLSLFMKFKPFKTLSYYYTAYLRLTSISDWFLNNPCIITSRTSQIILMSPLKYIYSLDITLSWLATHNILRA